MVSLEQFELLFVDVLISDEGDDELDDPQLYVGMTHLIVVVEGLIDDLEYYLI